MALTSYTDGVTCIQTKNSTDSQSITTLLDHKITDLTFRSPHHIRGLSKDCVTNSKILLSHFLLLGNEFSSSFQPLFGEYVFKMRNVSNSARITRPSGSCFEARNNNKCVNGLPLIVQIMKMTQHAKKKKKNPYFKFQLLMLKRVHDSLNVKQQNLGNTLPFLSRLKKTDFGWKHFFTINAVPAYFESERDHQTRQSLNGGEDKARIIICKIMMKKTYQNQITRPYDIMFDMKINQSKKSNTTKG